MIYEHIQDVIDAKTADSDPVYQAIRNELSHAEIIAEYAKLHPADGVAAERVAELYHRVGTEQYSNYTFDDAITALDKMHYAYLSPQFEVVANTRNMLTLHMHRVTDNLLNWRNGPVQFNTGDLTYMVNNARQLLRYADPSELEPFYALAVFLLRVEINSCKVFCV